MVFSVTAAVCRRQRFISKPAVAARFHTAAIVLARKSTATASAGAASTTAVPSPRKIDRVVVLSKVSLIDRILRYQSESSNPNAESSTAAGAVLHPSLDRLMPGQPIPIDMTTDAKAQRAAAEHRDSVNAVQLTLNQFVANNQIKDVRFVEHLSPTDVSWADLVVTVGGDGTFIRASHSIGDDETPSSATAAVLGVNSSPSSSYGNYTCATGATFAATLSSVLAGTLRPYALYRMRAYINDQPVTPPVLNEALLSAPSPATSSRYVLYAGKPVPAGSKQKPSGPFGGGQFQCSSGVWVSTAAGSTAAIHSAGGKVQRLDDRRFQYRVRELFKLPLKQKPFDGGYLTPEFAIVTRMRIAHLYVDGCLHPQPLRFGDRLTFRSTHSPLQYYVAPGTEGRRTRRANTQSKPNKDAVPAITADSAGLASSK